MIAENRLSHSIGPWTPMCHDCSNYDLSDIMVGASYDLLHTLIRRFAFYCCFETDTSLWYFEGDVYE